MNLSCFKAYDIRGILGETLDDAIARRIGRAFAETVGPGEVVVGHDARASSPGLADALISGLTERGASVVDIGLCGTEEVYFATGHRAAAGGVMVTASHNPIEYNGMKLVGRSSRPLDPATELAALKARAETDVYAERRDPGQCRRIDTRADYADHVAALAAPGAIGPLRLVANAGNGTAGAAFDAIAERLSAGGARLEIVRQHHAPDPTFPNGIPNPLLPENQGQTGARVVAEDADLGIAWDGDFDRCFFFDETGAIVPGEIVVAILAEAALRLEPGAAIVHDPRVTGAIEATIEAAAGRAVPAKTGHAFLKAKMRETNAPYGGEMSAHHYFREFFYCDSGMIPWVLLIGILSARQVPLSELVADLRGRFPSSGEINFKVGDPQATMERVVKALAAEARDVDRLDGASLSFDRWRMNIRASNTEPLLRLNVETRGDAALLAEMVTKVTGLIAAEA
ncbi:MAG: phosphomannomutase/phosphoglucomutase [Paracoccaceae bacterium]|nr:phosphomannomutase/phosphoglucomutase [Paracoccaceae bacterium]